MIKKETHIGLGGNYNPESLSLPRELEKMIDVTHPLYEGRKRIKLEDEEALYCFWWSGNPSDLDGRQKVVFQGPLIGEGDSALKTEKYPPIKTIGKKTRWYKAHIANFEVATEDRLIETAYLPLYVGKTTKLKSRIAQHLKPGLRGSNEYRSGHEHKLKAYEYKGATLLLKRDTACQFRAGMEYLLGRGRADEFVFEQIEKHIRISYLSAKALGFKKRFYGEDLLIGALQPWFNLDGER